MIEAILSAVLLVVAGFGLPTPSGEVLAAERDLRKVDATLQPFIRYLSIYTVPDRDRAETVKVLDFWLNSLSRRRKIAKMRKVTPTLYAINIDDYAWNKKTWERLADEDPYFHVKIQFAQGTEVVPWPGGVWAGDNKHYPAGAFTYNRPKAKANGDKTTSLAPWLPPIEGSYLVAATQSAAPIVRGDWWLSRTAIQAGREGTGYYDWLEIKEKKDYDKIVGFNEKESQRLEKEVAAIVGDSGVATFPRQIFRFQAITGGYWVTRDALDDNKNEKNAIRQLDEQYKHQAEELYAYLPNGLFVYYLSDEKGTRQDSAPDKISSDDTAPGRDKRIHIGLSCVRCHVEGLRPINDWARRANQGAIKLASPDPEKARRLQQLYLDDLETDFKRDVRHYEETLKINFDYTTAQVAKSIGNVWARYVEARLMPADGARELGVPEWYYMKRLKDYYKKDQLGDIVLASHLAGIPIRADDWEQIMPLVAPIVLGARPLEPINQPKKEPTK